jgi:lysophospholipase L1-like esterase
MATDGTRVATRSIGKKVVFAAVTVSLLFGLAEVAVRLSGIAEHCQGQFQDAPTWACDPLLGFKLRQDLIMPDGQPLNRAGFRTHEFTPKRSGVYRILTLGDSCTYGIVTTNFFQYIPEPYAQRLERIVAERAGPGKVEVLNAGVAGYNSFHGVMLMRTKLRGLAPDLVTVRFGWNDHFMSGQSGRGQAFREPESALSLAIQDLLLRTALYTLFRRVEVEVQALGRAAHKPTVADVPQEWVPIVPREQYKHNLRRIAEIARGRGAEVWFLTAPHAFETDENRGQYDKFPNQPSAKLLLAFNAIPSFDRLIEIHESYNAATLEVGTELNAPVIDMAELYREHASEHLFTSTDVPHPTQEGHNLEAEALYTRLVAEGVVTPLAR